VRFSVRALPALSTTRTRSTALTRLRDRSARRIVAREARDSLSRTVALAPRPITANPVGL
jgi:hypothetical protein